MIPKKVPLKEIHFAAKTGFLSRAIWEGYFSKRSHTRNIRAWRNLVQEKYFAPHNSNRMGDVIILADRGKKIVEASGSDVVSPPHINQITHDEIVSRIALGLMGSDNVVYIQTEGELRQKYMGWIKKTREGREAKLPDLLLEINGPSQNIKVALEIELSRKNPERYRKVMNSYAAQKTAERVVFISNDEYIFDRLAKAMKDTHYPSWEKPIGFSRLKEWTKDPMSADIYFSDHKTSLENLAAAKEKAAA
ncbi:MAG: hypothetical protein K2Q26_03565 [Bdellovibrionales bacterium]|nr:hypothetical protein [Bdellovibrionales bacterium]